VGRARRRAPAHEPTRIDPPWSGGARRRGGRRFQSRRGAARRGARRRATRRTAGAPVAQSRPHRVSPRRAAGGRDAIGSHAQWSGTPAAGRTDHRTVAVRPEISARPEARGGHVALRVGGGGERGDSAVAQSAGAARAPADGRVTRYVLRETTNRTITVSAVCGATV